MKAALRVLRLMNMFYVGWGWPQLHAGDHHRSLRLKDIILGPTEQARRWKTLPRERSLLCQDDWGQNVNGLKPMAGKDSFSLNLG